MNQAHRSAGKIAPRFDHPPPHGWSGRTRGSKSDLKYSQPQCLLSPNELTSSARAVTSEKCQQRTHVHRSKLAHCPSDTSSYLSFYAGVRNEGDRLDLDENVVPHDFGAETSADRRISGEILRADCIHPFVVGRILKHNDDLEYVAHVSAGCLDALLYVVKRQSCLFLDRPRNAAIVVITRKHD